MFGEIRNGVPCAASSRPAAAAGWDGRMRDPSAMRADAAACCGAYPTPRRHEPIAPARLAGALIAAVRAARARRRTRRALSALSDRMLRDIGLTRFDLDRRW